MRLVALGMGFLILAGLLGVYLVFSLGPASPLISNRATVSLNRVEVRAVSSGQVLENSLRVGSIVTEGSIIVELETAPLLASRDRLEAQLRSVRLELESLQYEAAEYQATIATNRNRVSILESRRSRWEPLVERGVISSDAFSNLELEIEAARNEIANAEIGLERIGIETELANQNLHPSLQVIEADLLVLDRRIAQQLIRAPVSGRVSRAHYATSVIDGQLIGEIITDDPVTIHAIFYVDEVTDITLGAAAEFRLAGSTETFTASVAGINVEVVNHLNPFNYSAEADRLFRRKQEVVVLLEIDPNATASQQWIDGANGTIIIRQQ